ncbi:MAG: hypothetical protein H6Q38_2633 [Chloroflexi bacterium]|nr:hypothetical protein [Chloroflexota bacterium]
MKKVWPWIIGVGVGLVIFSMLVFVRSDRHAYWIARGAIIRPQQVQVITVVRRPGHLKVYTQPVPLARDFYLWKK